jgi:integrase
MARLQKKRERDTNGAGSIAKLKDGRFQYWYYDPVTGKRRGKILMLPDETGREVPVTNKTDAEKSAKELRERITQLDSIKDTETAQRKLAESRKLIAGMSIEISEIWQKFLGSPSRKERISDGRLRTMKMVFDKFAAWCKAKGLSSAADVTGEVIIGFIREATKGLSSRSQWEYRLDLKTIFRDTYKQLGMTENPAAEIKGEKVNSTRREALTMEQVGKLFAGFDNGFVHEVTQKHKGNNGEVKEYKYTATYRPKFSEELRLVLMFALFSGARCKDAVLMKWSNIDMTNGVISYVPAKTSGTSGKRVQIPIVNDMFHNALWLAESWKNGNAEGEDYICPNVAHWYAANPTGVTATIGRCIEYAIGEDITATNADGRARKANKYGIHSLRHTFVSECWNSGIRLEAIADLAGHQNPMITETYLHKDMEVQRAELSKASFIGQGITTEEVKSNVRQVVADFLRTATESEVTELAKAIEEIKGRRNQIEQENEG